jgi:hypothetical protein
MYFAILCHVPPVHDAMALTGARAAGASRAPTSSWDQAPYPDDNAMLTMLEAGPDMHARMRFDLSRQDLVRIGRSAAPGRRPREAREDGSMAESADEWWEEGACLGWGQRQPQRPRSVGSVVTLRDIQVLQSKSEPTILARRGVILVCLEPLKAMVTAERLLVLVPPGSDAVLEPIRIRLHAAAKQRLIGECAWRCG